MVPVGAVRPRPEKLVNIVVVAAHVDDPLGNDMAPVNCIEERILLAERRADRERRIVMAGSQLGVAPVPIPVELEDPTIVVSVDDMLCAFALKHVARRRDARGERRAGVDGEIIVLPIVRPVRPEFVDVTIGSCIIVATLEEHMLGGSVNVKIIRVYVRR